MKYCRISGIVIFFIIVNAAYGAAQQEEKTALVRTEAISKHEISENISCFGTVTADPAELVSLNFTRAGQVVSLKISQGQIVKKGAPIMQLQTSPQDHAEYLQAVSQADFSRDELKRVERLFSLQLATKSQLAEAQRASFEAETSLDAHRKRGTDKKFELIIAPFDAIITSLKVALGDQVDAGATALQWVRRDKLRIVLGIEPEDAPRVSRGMNVSLSTVFDSKLNFTGRVIRTHGMVDPQTRLIDVVVGIPAEQALRLVPGMRISGTIILQKRKELAVQRQSVLKDEKGSYIFVIREGRAHRIDVQPGLESEGFIAISGAFNPNDRVVISGNYELTEGMKVKEATE